MQLLHNKFKVIFSRTVLVLCIFLVLPTDAVSVYALPSSALNSTNVPVGTSSYINTGNDINSIITKTPFYDPSAACDSSATQASTAPLTPGTGDPNGSSFPNLDPTAMANAINTWITQQNPKSELAGLGSTIVASAKNSNINPFLIVSIAHEESSLSSPSDFNVSTGNNSFGRSAGPGQPSFQGSRAWYKWTSVKASVDYTAPENINAAGGGDMATYIRQRFGSLIDSNNLLSFMEAYAPPSENNTASYVANLQGWISSLINLTTGTSGAGATQATASPTQTNNTCGCPSGGGLGASSTTAPSTSSVDLAGAQAAATAISGVQVGFAAADSNGNIIASYQGDMQESGASITKAMLLVAYLRQAGAQPPTGAENTQLTAMIENSDNAAANATFAQVEATAVQKVANDAGMSHFTLDTSDPLYVLGESKVTANDQAKLFGQINKLIPSTQIAYAQSLLTGISAADRWGILSANLPATVYSKAGWKQEPPSNNWILNQGALVVPNSGGTGQELGVAMVSFGSASQAAGEQLLQSVFTKLLAPISTTSSCGGLNSGGGSIVQTALNLSWPEPFANRKPSEGRTTATTPNAAYVAALQLFNNSEFKATSGTGDDCGVFIATVMRASGADPNYPVVSTVTQAKYVIAHPEKYLVIYPATSTAQLQPGDILILNEGTTQSANGTINIGNGAGGAGHTFIYVGPQAGGYNAASASLGDRTANLGGTQLSDNRGSYLIARLK